MGKSKSISRPPKGKVRGKMLKTRPLSISGLKAAFETHRKNATFGKFGITPGGSI